MGWAGQRLTLNRRRTKAEHDGNTRISMADVGFDLVETLSSEAERLRRRNEELSAQLSAQLNAS